VNRRYFTLVEVVVALAILTMGILAGMSLMAASRDRTAKATAQWREQHIMTQAMEYFMLAGIDNGVPEDVFPYRDYSVTAEYSAPQNLPADMQDTIAGWKLVTMTVTLRNANGTVVRKMSVDRIIKDGD